MKKEIWGIQGPEKECADKKCPFHGDLTVKSELLRGVVVKKDVNHSATISWFTSQHVPKYERYEVRRSRLRVHNPACIDAQLGDQVIVGRTRPLSKTKNHVIISRLEAKKMSKELLAEASREEMKEMKEKKKEAEKKNESS